MTQLHDPALADARAAGRGDPEPVPMFVNDIPYRFELCEDDIGIVGDVTITDALRSVGSGLPRMSVLATIADCTAGVPSCLATRPQLAVTLDIVVRSVADRCGDRLDFAGEIVKQGRSTVASEVRFSDAGTKALVALCYVTFMASPRPQDLAPPLLRRRMQTNGSMATPFAEHVGLRTIAPGTVEVDLVPSLLQGSRTLQGGIIALLGEAAAESLTQRRVLDLDVRYLNAVRVGPGRATATALGGGLIRVEVRDRGSDDRLASLILVRVAPAD
jgi:acyl-coenzyme A thioesterase PaaI-like protein